MQKYDKSRILITLHKMYFKLHKTPEKCFISVCDKELVGGQFEEGNLFLDIKKNFYKGSLEEIEITEEISSILFIGKNSTTYGLKKNLIDKSSIKKVKNIPFVEVIFL